MANEQNLTQKGKTLSTEKAQRMAKLSAEARRQKKSAREFALAALNAVAEDKNGKKYHEMLLEHLHSTLADLGHPQIKVDITQMDNANLIGSAIAALS